MFYDDLPIWGFIGKVEKIMAAGAKSWEAAELKYYLFTHIHFDILYNGDRVIEVCAHALMAHPLFLAVISRAALLLLSQLRWTSPLQLLQLLTSEPGHWWGA